MMLKLELYTGTMLQTNNMVIGNETDVIIVEASASLEKVVQAVARRKVHGILLTHGHWDHYQTLQELATSFDVPIFCSQGAKQKVLYTTERTPYMKMVPITLPEKSFCLVKHNQVLQFGFVQITVIATPGHTDCSVSYLVNGHLPPAELSFSKASPNVWQLNGSILLSGDTLFAGGQGRTDLPTGNQAQIEKSIANLLTLPFDMVVIPGHGNPTTIGNELNGYNL